MQIMLYVITKTLEQGYNKLLGNVICYNGKIAWSSMIGKAHFAGIYIGD